ncbi:hypothetical protein ACGFY9_14120 [Streptomyces sp. NPDC048504]|uniref:hypothetical protein n=1 Tax=Streptomyces sp. NPDC048504 TaxID=3365559 RepID=UPI003713099D
MSARCAHWIGAEGRVCGSDKDVHRHVNSVVCPLHTPSALAGRPEPGTKPHLTGQ